MHPSKAYNVVAICLLIFMLISPIRKLLESNMVTHMFVQFPILILIGILFGCSANDELKLKLNSFNKYGIAGLLLAAFMLMIWMTPRLLDDVLDHPLIEGAKFISLVLGVGFAISVSWKSAGFIFQGFFLGNVLPTMSLVGWLYIESPVRLCNAYLTNQQSVSGVALVYLSVVIALGWLSSFFMPIKLR